MADHSSSLVDGDLPVAGRPAPPPGLEGAALVAALQRRERAAGEAFVRRFQVPIYRLLLRMVGHPETAQDLAQDTLLKALTAIGSFQGHSGLMTWVYRIAMNAALSHQRKAVLRRTVSLDAPAGADPDDADRPALGQRLGGAAPPDARQAQQQLVADLHAALADLDPDTRALLWLRDVDGLDYDQIGDVLSVPLGTVKSRLHRARASLRELLVRRGVYQGGDQAKP